jgi:uncharacterized protein YraI
VRHHPAIPGLALSLVALTLGCAGSPGPATTVGGNTDTTQAVEEPSTPDVLPDDRAPTEMEMPPMNAGDTLRVTAGQLNLRVGPTTDDTVLTTMACGDEVTVVAGPENEWWNVQYGTYLGWASGKYLVPQTMFDNTACMTSQPGQIDQGGVDAASILARAQLGVGYSYWWGHGAWREDGAQRGACFGSCPNCTHQDDYGADCSGFVAKAWQIPSPTPLATDRHPFATYNFYHQSSSHWDVVPRSELQPADALVYNANGSGHIVLVEKSTDPWGSLWLYEARGCSYGIVHNLRTISTSYKAIRRPGL